MSNHDAWFFGPKVCEIMKYIFINYFPDNFVTSHKLSDLNYPSHYLQVRVPLEAYFHTGDFFSFFMLLRLKLQQALLRTNTSQNTNRHLNKHADLIRGSEPTYGQSKAQRHHSISKSLPKRYHEQNKFLLIQEKWTTCCVSFIKKMTKLHTGIITFTKQETTNKNSDWSPGKHTI